MKDPQYTHEDIDRLEEILHATRLLYNSEYEPPNDMSVDQHLEAVFKKRFPHGDWLVVAILEKAYMPFEEVPLYVGIRSEALEALVKWRLEIGK